MQVSIIVPTLNEAPLICPFLARLRERAPGAEIIVVDGASTDGTYELAAGLCDQLIRSNQRSRALQMNAGAGAANGDCPEWLVLQHRAHGRPVHRQRVLPAAGGSGLATLIRT